MATFGTGQLKNLPRNIADGMVKDVVQGSTVAALSARRPQRFGNEDIITFTGRPKAEFVGEGQAKSSTTGEFDFVTSTPKKTQVTMRFNEEVQWADQDYQLGVLDTLSEAGAEALARALDLGLYHRINPLTGTEIEGWSNYLNAADRRVEITPATAEAPELVVEAAIGLLVANGHPTPVNGMALHPSLAWGLSTERFADGRKKYPELGLGIDLGSYNGLRSSTSDTVAGGDEALPALAEARAVRGIVGDFANGIRWGVQREIPLELIKYGDPDGQGDLKRHNQIALRLEIVYGWYVFTDRFVVIEDAVA
ncbi:major capsid protein [Mycobacterium phage Mercurio]|uniref:Major capsid protein n=1 Tax=Mycobacterium phage Mercurio TaxID=2575612 RepID=A0A5J6T9G2_9CAUD|nr:major capsid protein [Mycobacterium phage Mercurio]QFG06010.1 major capsid protein [Mycobacterium phage Mercurio]